MNKEQCLIVLQVALFNFDGGTEKQIQELNSDYDLKLIRKGIQICEDLKQ